MSENIENSNGKAVDIDDLLARIENLEARLGRLESAPASQPEFSSTEQESPAEAVEASPLTPVAEAAPAADCSEELESLKSQLATLEQRLKQSNERSKELVEKLQQKELQLEEKSAEISKLEADIKAKDDKIAEHNNEYNFCYGQYESYKKEHSEAVEQLQATREELNNTTDKLSDERARAEKAEDERDATRRQLGLETQTLEATRKELNDTQSTLEHTQQALAEAEQNVRNLSADLDSRKVLFDRLWPDCMRIPALADYAAVWHEELSNPSADPILLSMFANIFSWACAHEVAERGEGDNSFDQAAIVSLYTFSRFFFEWLYRHRINPEEADRLSHALSSYINSKLEASNRDYRIETEEVQIDDPYSSKMMMPSPHGASTGVVTSIESWCIMNRSGSVCHKKAQVCLG